MDGWEWGQARCAGHVHFGPWQVLIGAVGVGQSKGASPACRAVVSWKRRASASGSKAELIAEARRCCTSWGWGPRAALYWMLWLQRRNEGRLPWKKCCVEPTNSWPGPVCT